MCKVCVFVCVREQIITVPYLHLRYEGTDCALMCTTVTDDSKTSDKTSDLMKHGDFENAFITRLHTFGFYRLKVKRYSSSEQVIPELPGVTCHVGSAT